MDKEADVNLSNSCGSKPIHIAAKNGHKEIVEFHLSQGVSVDYRDNDDNTPLHYIAKEKDVPILMREKHQDLVNFLVDRNCNLNAVTKEGYTPLLLAAVNSRKDLVELFIRLGARTDCSDYRTRTTLLHHSAASGWLEIIRSVVEGEFKVDLNARTSKKVTPLYLALAEGYISVAEYLFESGAEFPTEKNDLYGSILHYVCQEGMLDAVKCVVRMGADINGKDYRDMPGWTKGDTPLMVAALRSYVSISEYLIDSGADLKVRGSYGETALLCACENESIAIVKALLKGSDLNAQDMAGDTALHTAVDGKKLELTELLLKAGADFNIENRHGMSPFNVLLFYNPMCLDVIGLFLEKGAHFQSRDYIALNEQTSLKKSILKDSKLCTLAVMNKFNNIDLPNIYDIPEVSKCIPPIETLKVVSETSMGHAFAQTVKNEIRTKKYCNISKVLPITLTTLSVNAIFKHKLLFHPQ